LDYVIHVDTNGNVHIVKTRGIGNTVTINDIVPLDVESPWYAPDSRYAKPKNRQGILDDLFELEGDDVLQRLYKRNYGVPFPSSKNPC